MAVLGIDPGKQGAMVCLAENGDVLGSQKLDASESDIRNWLAEIQVDSTISRVFLEKVCSGPKMGSSASFTFGQGYGFIRGLLIGCCMKFEEVSPHRWQTEFMLLTSGRKLGEKDGEKKRANRAKAQQLFPGESVPLWKADALLIAEYGRRQK